MGDRCKHSTGAVSAGSIVEGLDPVEDRSRQFDSGPPLLRVEQLGLHPPTPIRSPCCPPLLRVDPSGMPLGEHLHVQAAVPVGDCIEVELPGVRQHGCRTTGVPGSPN
jgi:hypothetical protein